MRRNVVRLGIASLFMDISGEMVRPIYPVILTRGLGAGADYLGFLEALSEVVEHALKVGCGVLSDRLRRRRTFVWVGYLLTTLSRFILFAASAPSHVLVFRVTDRAGKGVRTSPRDAMLSEASGLAERGTAFGVHRALDTAGAFLGPLIGAVLLFALTTREVVLFSVLPAFVSVLVVVLWVKPSRRMVTHRRAAEEEGVGRGFGLLLLAMAVFGFARVAQTFYILRALEFRVTQSEVLLLWTLFNAVYAGMSVPVGRAADRLGAWRVVCAAMLLKGVLLVSFAHLLSRGAVVLLFAVYGAYHALYDGPVRALVSERARLGRGGAFAAFYLTAGGAALASNILFGTIWQRISAKFAFSYAALFACAAALLMALIAKSRFWVDRPTATEQN